MERLSKYLSRAGIASRRHSEEIIRSGRITVNGIRIVEPQFRVDALKDTVKFDGKTVSINNQFLYVVLYKPVGYISDLKDPQGRKLARDLIDSSERLYPVGRLDYNSEGLMLFTNDGELANIVMHPRYNVEKEYLVKFTGTLNEADQVKMKKGVTVHGVFYKVNDVSFVRSSFSNSWYSIIINEGKNRIIRIIGDSIGHSVLKLKRVRIGNLKIGRMLPGQYRFLKHNEIRPLRIRSERHS